MVICILYLVGPCQHGGSMEEVMDTPNQPPHPWLMSDGKMTIMITQVDELPSKNHALHKLNYCTSTTIVMNIHWHHNEVM